MRSYLSKDVFFRKMKKKADLQKILDNIENYTGEDINNLSGTHFPQWIKEQLLDLKKRNGKTSDDVAEEIAAKMIAASRKDS